MNVDAIHRVADAIEKAEMKVGFNMAYLQAVQAIDTRTPRIPDYTGRDCGTVACVAGWTCLAHRVRAVDMSMTHAREILDITFDQANKLFTPPGYAADDGDPGCLCPVCSDAKKQSYRGYYTAKRAVYTLRHLAKTGRVAWSAMDRKKLPPVLTDALSTQGLHCDNGTAGIMEIV